MTQKSFTMGKVKPKKKNSSKKRPTKRKSIVKTASDLSISHTTKALLQLSKFLQKIMENKKERKNREASDLTSDLPVFDNYEQLLYHFTEKLDRKKANEFLKDKESRQLLFSKHLKIPSPMTAWEKYEKLRENENLHIKHVRACMDELQPDLKPNRHDYSKDELYFFVEIISGHFDSKIPISLHEKYRDEHYKTERHHEEYEKLNSFTHEITDADILETAIEKLSRNLQYNDGKYNLKKLKEKSPKYQHHQEKRLNLYNTYIISFSSFAQNVWQKLKLENKN